MNVWLALGLVAVVAVAMIVFFWRATRLPSDDRNAGSGGDQNVTDVGSDGSS